MKYGKILIIAGLILVAGTLIINLFVFSSLTKSESDDRYLELTKKQYRIFDAYIPDTVMFAGEMVPLDNIIVRERLEREILANMYWHSHTILLLKRGARYFPVISPILEKNGIPDDFKFLAMAESELTNAVSPAGAAGYWQFLKSTAQKYNLEVTEEVDERYNLRKSTHAACRYLQDSYNSYKNWTLAAASYNMGAGALNEAMATQGNRDYYELLLNQETSRYIYRIIALKLLWENPVNYGYFLRNCDLYPPIKCTELQIDSSITNLVRFAKSQNLSYLVLKEFNPWLRKNALNNPGRKKYIIEIPLTLSYKELLNQMSQPDRVFGDSVEVQ